MHSFSPERLGALLRETTECRKSSQRLEQKIDELSRRQEADEHDRTRGKTLLAVGRWIVGLVCGALISGTTWIYAQHREHDVKITRSETVIAGVRDDLDRHERSPGHERSQQEVSQLRGDMRAVQATLEEVRSTLRSVDTQLRQTRWRRQ